MKSSAMFSFALTIRAFAGAGIAVHEIVPPAQAGRDKGPDLRRVLLKVALGSVDDPVGAETRSPI